MKVAYIAGPFRASTHWGIVESVRRAEAMALKYWRLGYAVICPHMNTANFQGAIDDDRVWLNGDLEILRRSDTVVMMKGWQRSEGACNEHLLAQELGKEIIYDDKGE